MVTIVAGVVDERGDKLLIRLTVIKLTLEESADVSDRIFVFLCILAKRVSELLPFSARVIPDRVGGHRRDEHYLGHLFRESFYFFDSCIDILNELLGRRPRNVGQRVLVVHTKRDRYDIGLFSFESLKKRFRLLCTGVG